MVLVAVGNFVADCFEPQLEVERESAEAFASVPLLRAILEIIVLDNRGTAQFLLRTYRHR